ncbi:MAG TPA: hypothetical protein VHP36_02240 [Chitinispirillaceae bacterium]|nr:hypothetical protein [Chitinispirillaceae bacterium]
MDLLSYYKNEHVRARMTEFLGGKTLDSASCMFLTQCDVDSEAGWNYKLPHELDYFLTQGIDVSRSLWDKKWLLAHLDVEYVNYDFPAEPYLDPDRSFLLQKPAELAIQKILLAQGIAPLHVLSGRGHHFTWSINRQSSAFGKLVMLGHLPIHLEKKYAELLAPVNKPIDHDLGAAYSGLALVMEFVAMIVRDMAQTDCLLPIELSAVEVPPQARGREMVSIDITEYGDLLNTRLIRVPFSVYLKPWQKLGILPDELRDRIPPMVAIPLFEMDIKEGINVMRDLNEASLLSTRAAVQIPDQSTQMLDLIRLYEKSEIAQFHNWYYSEEHYCAESWPSTYDKLPLEILPPCIVHMLQFPNDLLLKPAGIRQTVRVMLALGWHPRHIAGLIRSKFERNYGWGREWYFYDAATRADFYTRVFSAMIKTGRDRLDTFDCRSAKQMHYCYNEQPGCNLYEYKLSLEKRIKHERLANRHFNRLFLSDEHL